MKTLKLLTVVMLLMLVTACSGAEEYTWYGDYCLPSGLDCGHAATGEGRECDPFITIEVDGVDTTYTLNECTVATDDTLK